MIPFLDTMKCPNNVKKDKEKYQREDNLLNLPNLLESYQSTNTIFLELVVL